MSRSQLFTESVNAKCCRTLNVRERGSGRTCVATRSARPRAHGSTEARLDHRLRKCLGALGLRAVRLAEIEAVRVGVLDDAWLDHLGRGVDDASEHAVRRELLPEDAAGIDGLQPRSFVGPA